MPSMKSFVLTAALAAAAEAGTLRRWLSYDKLAGFSPGTDVADHTRIDLDQQAIAGLVDEGIQDAYDAAYKIYTEGGHSKSVATLSVPAGLGTSLKQEAKVVGKSASGEDIVLTALQDYDSTATSVELVYATPDCYVGGLPETDQVLTGCLNATGQITPVGTSGVTYSYDPTKGNTNDRTLQYFSATANERMRHDANTNMPFYDSFVKFLNYYGDATYGDMWVTAAYNGASTGFSSGRGDADFSKFDLTSRAEAFKKGTAYINAWVYVLRELEHGLDSCNGECNEDDCVGDAPSGSVDEAAAFYIGSLEGVEGTLGEGVMPYSLANKRCQNFKTCGTNGNELTGNSKVNTEVLQQFAQMVENLSTSKCDAARKNKERVAQLMAVPMIQGVLRYADILANNPDADDGDRLEGATFAAAVLPVVHNCSTADAETIYKYMNANSQDKADFAAVKGAFERNYGCMGVSCADVGGIIDEGTGTYKSGAGPCAGSSSSSSSSVNVGLAVGLSVGAVAAILLVYLWCKCCRKSSMVETKSGGDESGVA